MQQVIPRSSLKRDILQKGFSLIELLIVIVVISLVYVVGLSSFDVSKPKAKALTPLNLKKTIVSSEFFTGHATLMCVDKCRTCYLRQDVSASFTPYANKIDLKGIKAYTIDSSDSLREIEYHRYNDKRICLVMDFYNNGSSTQIILEDKKGAYFLPAFFGDAKKFDSPEDAKEYWLKKSTLISDSGEYY